MPNGPIAERLGVDDAWIVKRTGIRSRRARGRRRAPRRPRRRSPRARRSRDAGVDAARRRPRPRRDDEPGRADAERRAARRARARRRARRRDRRRRRLHRLAVGARSSPPARSRPAAPSACCVIGAEILTRLDRLRRPQDRRAVRRRRRRRGPGRRRRRRRDRPDRARRRRLAGRHDRRHARGPQDPHGRPRDVPERGQAPVRGHRRGDARAPASSSTTSTSSSTTRPTGASSRAVGERLELPPSEVVDYIGELGNTSAASIPLALGAAARGRPPAAGPRACCVAAIGAGFTWGAGVRRVGDRDEPPRERHARSSPAPRAGIGAAIAKALAADGWAVARQLPRRRGRRQARPSTAIEDARRRAPSRSRATSPTARRDDAVRDGRGRARPGARARQQRRRPRRRPRRPARRRRLGRGHRHQPHRRLPPHPRARCGR